MTNNHVACGIFKWSPEPPFSGLPEEFSGSPTINLSTNKLKGAY
jgi:hypothetical protein